jgi:hypothetical protein
MKVLIVLLITLLVIAGFWLVAVKANKKGLLEDKNDNAVPDVVEDKINGVKNAVNDKIEDTKRKIKNVKDALK